MVPLTYDLMFKNVFTNDLDVLKEFLILETDLYLDPKTTYINLLNTELSKENMKEYKKTIDIYISLNDKVNIDVELNNSNFNKALSFGNIQYLDKLFTTSVENGKAIKEAMEKVFIQLNLNTKDIDIPFDDDILMTYGIKSNRVYVDNKKIILKYLAYYKRMYYTFDVKLNKSELWLVVILSETFEELYDLLESLLTKEKRDKFLWKVINMSKDTFILHEWEKEKMDELKELARLEDAETLGLKRGFEKGLKHGIEQGIVKNKLDVAKNMLDSNMSIDMISKFTGLSIEEIEVLRN